MGRPIIIAEVGINADGDIKEAKKLIEMAKDCGSDFIKFQKRDINLVYTESQLNSYRESPFGTTFREQKEGLEFDLEEYKEIDRYCKEKEIPWFASAWDLKSIDFLVNNFPNMLYLKIPSAKLNDPTFLRKCKESNIPLIMSTGMSDMRDIDISLDYLGRDKHVKYLLGCTSSYPTPAEDINLNQIKLLKYTYGHNYKIGWSDHSGNVLCPALATSLGIEMLEVHITLSRMKKGSDHSSSIEPEGLRKLVKYIDFIELAMGEIDKKIQESELSIIKKLRGV